MMSFTLFKFKIYMNDIKLRCHVASEIVQIRDILIIIIILQTKKSVCRIKMKTERCTKRPWSS